MGLLADILRAAADGLDQAAGRDPVDAHAEQAAAVVNGHRTDTLAARPVAASDDDPDTVELTGPVPTTAIGIRLGLALSALRDLRRQNAEYEHEIKRLNDEAAAGPGVTREGLGHDLMAAWFSTGDTITTNARWEMVADCAIRAIRPRRHPFRRITGVEFETACHGLARSLHGVDPADLDHAEKLDEWAHADGQHLVNELGRRGLGLVRIGTTS